MMPNLNFKFLLCLIAGLVVYSALLLFVGYYKGQSNERQKLHTEIDTTHYSIQVPAIERHDEGKGQKKPLSDSEKEFLKNVVVDLSSQLAAAQDSLQKLAARDTLKNFVEEIASPFSRSIADSAFLLMMTARPLDKVIEYDLNIFPRTVEGTTLTPVKILEANTFLPEWLYTVVIAALSVLLFFR